MDIFRDSLYVEQNRFTQNLGSYELRYFVLFPFCGLKWFKKDILHLDYLSLLKIQDEDCGWVYGSNITPSEVFTKPRVVIDDKEYFPFHLILNSGNHESMIQLATSDLDKRNNWISNINRHKLLLSYIDQCIENSFFPYPKLYSGYFDRISEYVYLRDLNLSGKPIMVIARFLTDFYPNTLLFHTLRLENTYLSDSDVPVVNQIIQANQYIEKISLSDNQITSEGLINLCKSLSTCSNLRSLILANNFIGDESADIFSRMALNLKELRHLDLSKNKLTANSSKLLINRLATHRSKLETINVSYNILGDGAASLVSLLMYNVPSHLKNFDISYCGVTENGLKDITAAIPHCRTLQKIAIKGSFFDTVALQQFVHTVTEFQEKKFRQISLNQAIRSQSLDPAVDDASQFSELRLAKSYLAYSNLGSNKARRDLRKENCSEEEDEEEEVDHETNLKVTIGGLLQDGNSILSMPFSSLKAAMPYVSDHSLLKTIALRSKEVSLKVNDDIQIKRPIIALKLTFPSYITSAEQFLALLSATLNLDVRHFSLVSNSMSFVSSSRETCFLMFSISEVQSAFALQKKIAVPNLHYLIGASSFTNRADLFDQLQEKTVSEILEIFLSHAADSSPALRMLGIKYVFIRYHTLFMQPDYLSRLSELRSKETFEISFPLDVEDQYRVQNFLIHQPGFGGQGLLDSFVPLLHPPNEPVSSNDSLSNSILLTDHESNWMYDQIAELQELFEQKISINQVRERQKHAKHSHNLFGKDEGADLSDEEDEDEKEHQMMVKLMEKRAQLRLLKEKNERLIHAIRELHSTGEISSRIGKFWEGAFGNWKYKEWTQQTLRMAIHNPLKVYNTIYASQLLWNAMFQRDTETLQSYVSKFELEYPQAQMHSLVYAHRLISQLAAMKKKFADVDSLAKSFKELSLVEEFCLSCGIVGYSGPEMLQAVDLRQKLLRGGKKKDAKRIADELPMIKTRALLTNLMISRDMAALDVNILEYLESRDEMVLEMPEFKAAQVLQKTVLDIEASLRKAMQDKSIDELDRGISMAAYHSYFSDTVSQALEVLTQLTSNPSRLLTPIVEGFRSGNVTQIEDGIRFANKMGWFCDALRFSLCTKILQVKASILQKHDVNSRIVKYYLAIRNGLQVPPADLMQLLRKAYETKVYLAPNLKEYIKVIEKQMRKFSSVLKQERAIQNLIDRNDIDKLLKLVEGRGMGKLVLHAPSQFVLDEWYEQLSLCADGHFYKTSPKNAHGHILNDKEIFFNGVLEKAARRDKGAIGGWKQRYFEMNAVRLTYYTRQGGDRKGYIRLLGGGVRRMHPNEVYGRHHCLEIEEGRDISLISPELIDEVKNRVRKVKAVEYEKELLKAIEENNAFTIKDIIEKAKRLEILLNHQLMNSARKCLLYLEQRNLKRRLYFCALLFPKLESEEVLGICDRLQFDPAIPAYRSIKSLLEMNELEQTLIRAQSAVRVHDTALFTRYFDSALRYDISQYSSKQKNILAALLFEHSGHKAMTLSMQGFPHFLVMKYLKHALNSSSQLLIEIEPFDMARFLLAFSSQMNNSSNTKSSKFFNMSVLMGSENIMKVASTALNTDLRYYLSNFFALSDINPQFHIHKFPQLRVAASTFSKRKNRLLGGVDKHGVASEQLKINENLSYATELKKSLLKYKSSSSQQQQQQQQMGSRAPLEAFLILQVIMKDQTMHALPNPKKASLLQRKHSDRASLILDLLSAACFRVPIIRDELYFQLAKQITNNPRTESKIMGWLLFCVYLHCFPPSNDALNYLLNFVASEVEASVDMDFRRQSELDRYCWNISMYCNKLVHFAEINSSMLNLRLYSIPLDQKRDEAVESLVSQEMLQSIIEQERLEVELVLMTGSVYRISVPFGQLDTPMSLLMYLYDKIQPNDSYYRRFYHKLAHVDKFDDLEDDAGSSSVGLAYDHVIQQLQNQVPMDPGHSTIQVTQESPQGLSSETLATEDKKKDEAEPSSSSAVPAWHKKKRPKQDMSADYFTYKQKLQRVLTLFRGFTLFAVDESELNEEGMIDLLHIPIQPDNALSLEWSDDLQWELLKLHSGLNESHSPSDLRATLSHGDRVASGTVEMFKYCNSLVLRKNLSIATETFSSAYEVFQEHVADQQVDSIQSYWTRWLASPHDILPPDNPRVDILFAEDSRYVNSRLYPLNDASFHYLLAIQLTLCWVNEDPASWGDGDDDTIDGITLSVRPCYKFYPKHMKYISELENIDALHDEEEGEDSYEEVSGDEEDQSGDEIKQVRPRKGDKPTSMARRVSLFYSNKSDKKAQKKKRKQQKDMSDASSESSRSEPGSEAALRREELAEKERIKALLRQIEEGSDDDNAPYESSESSSSSSSHSSSGSDADSGAGKKREKRASSKAAHRILKPVLDKEGVTPWEQAALRRYLENLGIHADAVDTDLLWDQLVALHIVAVETKVNLSNPKFRYLLKRAYLEYLRCACVYYGYFFYSACLRSYEGQRLKALNDVRGETLVDAEVLVGISSKGLVLLDQEDWRLIFSCPIWDIQEFKIKKAPAARMDKGDSAASELLELSVNSMRISLESENAADIVLLLNKYCLDTLGYGAYPYGSEAYFRSLQADRGDSPTVPTAPMGAVPFSSKSSQASSAMSLFEDAKTALKKYLNFFPILPRPSIPDLLEYSDKFFEAPLSQRDLMSKEKAEEEEMEREMSRLALEAQTERTQQQIQKGRSDMMKYHDQEAKAAEEDDDASDISAQEAQKLEAQEGGKSKRKNRSLLGGLRSERLREQLEKDRLNATVCGVSKRSSKFLDIEVPLVPTRIGDTMKSFAFREQAHIRTSKLDKPSMHLSPEEETLFDNALDLDHVRQSDQLLDGACSFLPKKTYQSLNYNLQNPSSFRDALSGQAKRTSQGVSKLVVGHTAEELIESSNLLSLSIEPTLPPSTRGRGSYLQPETPQPRSSDRLQTRMHSIFQNFQEKLDTFEGLATQQENEAFKTRSRLNDRRFDSVQQLIDPSLAIKALSPVPSSSSYQQLLSVPIRTSIHRPSSSSESFQGSLKSIQHHDQTMLLNNTYIQGFSQYPKQATKPLPELKSL